MKVIERWSGTSSRTKATVASLFTVQGFSFGGSGQNSGIAFVNLKDWSERKSPELGVNAVAGRAMGALSQIKDALAFAFPPPAMPELGTSAGFAFYLKDNLGLGHEALTAPATSSSAPRRRARCSPTCARTARTTRRSSASTWTWRRPARSGCPRRTSTPPSPRRGAASTSTTSSTVAASSACSSRRTRRSGWCPRTSSAGRCATGRGRWCPPRASRARGGGSARPGSSATTACRRWRSGRGGPGRAR